METDMPTMTEQKIIERYEHLAALHKNPDACFVCGKVRPLVNALLLGPGDAIGKTIANRAHGVCRPCVKAGEATRFL
jgi:hypothetical protein